MEHSKSIRRVACAISGGVDSAVSALLLKRRGFDVIGVHMTKDHIDAEKLCDFLKIELHSANFVKEYWNEVFSNMVKNYSMGRTVVPDIVCNKLIKFDLWRRYVFEKLDADALATGHFARTSQGDYLENGFNNIGKVKLIRAKDIIKDQTYFLASLNEAQLHRIMFPVGSLYKNEVREIAKAGGMEHFARKHESMGICFIGKKRNFNHFIGKYIDATSGSFIDIDTGKTIPGMRHSGVHNFTLGKRVRPEHCSFPLHNFFENGEAFYVADIDPSTQSIYLCTGSSNPKLYAKRIVISKPTWISGQAPDGLFEAKRLQCSIQRTISPVACTIYPCPNDDQSMRSEFYELEFDLPLRATAPGQTCVFYSGVDCLGCTRIESVLETL